MLNVKNEVLYRVYGLLMFVVLLALVIFYKALDISVIEGEKWRNEGRRSYYELKDIKAERGNILSADGSFLATSLPFFEIRFDPNSSGMREEDFNENIDSLAICLATYVSDSFTIGGYKQYLIDERAAGNRYIKIKSGVSYSEMMKIKKFPLFNLGKYRGGLIINRIAKRDRPLGLLAQRTIGYVRDGAKPVGLEGYFDNVLGGKKGKQMMRRVSANTWMPIEDLTAIEPQNGDDIVTTIDINLQESVEKALYRAVKYHNADHGTAVLMETETGAIRAIANIGRLANNKLWETYNYAVGEAVEPGSTYKLAAMMALMEDGHIDLDDSIDLEQGRANFYEEEMVDASYHQLDTTTIRKAFEISSNVGIAKLTQKYYEEEAGQFISRLKEMNLHLPVGIEIEGEAAPYIKEAYSEEDEWSGTTIPWMSIGYELTITPLQLLAFFNAVANNGQMMKPYLVSEIQHFGKTKTSFKPTVVKRRIASPSTIRKAQSLLEGVVERGTAKKWKSSRYDFAGKTGTAQIDYRKFKPRSNIKHRASFAGYFPADNPKFTCVVMITEPKEHGIYGSEVALPVFREIADRCFDSKIELHQALNKRRKPDLKGKQLPVYSVGDRMDLVKVLEFLDVSYENYANDIWAVTRAESDTLNLEPRYIQDDVVPSVVGMGLRDALYILENRGLNVVISGTGKVVLQSIRAGTKIKGQTIKLKLASNT
ncbi:MAG: penicillin-binding protein [Bacteroidota bacterium]